MKFWLILKLFLASSILSHKVNSQDLPILHQTFGIENGLFNTIINDALAASGTDRYFASEGNGLIHYHNGIFSYYSTPEGIRVPFINSIANLNKDTLLAASENEVYFFYINSKTFEKLVEIPSHEKIRKIQYLRGFIYLLSSEGNIYISERKTNFKKVDILPLESARHISQSSDHTYVLANDSIVYRIDGRDIEKYYSNGELIYKFGYLNGYLIVFQSNKIIRFNPYVENIIYLKSKIHSVQNITSNKEFLLSRIAEDQLMSLDRFGKIQYINIHRSHNRFFLLENGELWSALNTSLKCYLYPSVSEYIGYNLSEDVKIYDLINTDRHIFFSTGKNLYSVDIPSRSVHLLPLIKSVGLILQIKKFNTDTILLNTETGLYYFNSRNKLYPVFDKEWQQYFGTISIHPSNFISIPVKNNLVLISEQGYIEYSFDHLILWHHWIDSSSLIIQSENFLHFYKIDSGVKSKINSINIPENTLVYPDSETDKIWCFSDERIIILDSNSIKDQLVINLKRENILKVRNVGRDSLTIISDQIYFIYYNESKIHKHILRHSDWILKRLKLFDFFTDQSKLYFVSGNGILEVHNRIFFPDDNIKIFIENTLVNGSPIDISNGRKFKSNENTIHLFFAIDSDIFSEKEFRYRFTVISGSRKTDTVKSSIPELYLPNLSADSYIIKYEILSSDDSIIDYGYLKFFIQKPPWQNIWFIALVLFGIVSISVYIIRWRTSQIKEKVKLKEMLLETETKALRLQMNPHFLYNSLESIEGFILKSDKISALKHLNNFTRLMRMILEGSDKGLHTLKREKDLLTYYLELECMRSGNSFDFSIEIIPETVNQDELIIPSMLIQPHVENSIIHGVRPLKDRRGCIRIIFYVYPEEQKIEAIIEDNGVGRSKSSELSVKNHVKSKSLALHINAKRLNIMSQTYNKLFFVSIEDVYDNFELPSGTRVRIIMPIVK